MASMPFDAASYNNYLASLTGKPMVQIPQHHQTLPHTKPTLLPFAQFPPVFSIPQVPFSAPPINVAPWNSANWPGSQQGIPHVPPPFPASFQTLRQPAMVPASQQPQQSPSMLGASSNPPQPPPLPPQSAPQTLTISPLLSAKSPTFLPSQTNLSQWPPLPNFVPSNASSSAGSAKTKSSPMTSSTTFLLSGIAPQNRAVSAPPPVDSPPQSSKSKTSTTTSSGTYQPAKSEPFRQLCSQLRLLLDKMVPLNFDSTASRIRKMLTDRAAMHDTDQFCEAVRIIIDHAIASTDHQDAFNMYINLFRSLSKAGFVADDDAKQVNFLNTVVNCCFTLLHIRNSQSTSESEKPEKDDDKDSQTQQTTSGAPQSREKMVGSVRLIAALYKAKELTKGQIVDCINRLIRLEGENAFACIHELLRLIGRDFDESVKTQKDKQTWWSNLFETLKFVERRSVSTPKIRAWIQEILEAKENNWTFPESNDDEMFREELKRIVDSLPVTSESSAQDLFAIASKRLRQLVPLAERRPYLFTEMMDALLAKCHYYHNEVLGTGKTVVETEKFARMQIENEVMSKQKQNYAESLKAKDKMISGLQEKNHQLDSELAKLAKEITSKEETIEQQMLNEASYRSNIQQAFDAKVDEFRKQLAIELQAYIGSQ